MGFTCKVFRGFSAFTPSLEHVRAGGGGGQMHYFVCMKALGLYFAFGSLRTCTE